MNILELILGIFCNKYAYGAALTYLEAKKDFFTIIEPKEINFGAISSSSLATQHKTLAQGILLTTVG